jgi:hypothetical protein
MPTTNPPLPLLGVRPKEARAILKCGQTKLYQLIDEKKLEVVHLGPRLTIISMTSIERLLTPNPPPAETIEESLARACPAAHPSAIREIADLVRDRLVPKAANRHQRRRSASRSTSPPPAIR